MKRKTGVSGKASESFGTIKGKYIQSQVTKRIVFVFVMLLLWDMER